MADWIWFYGIRPQQETIKGLSKTESRWLNPQRPLSPTERDETLRALTTPTSNYYNATPHPLFSHAWWCAYDLGAGRWGPWHRYSDTGAPEDEWHEGKPIDLLGPNWTPLGPNFWAQMLLLAAALWALRESSTASEKRNLWSW